MKGRPAGPNGRLALGLAAFLLGLVLAWQFRSQAQVAQVEPARPEEQARLLADLIQANADLARQASSLQLQLLTYRQVPRQNETDLLVADLNRLKLVNGLAEAVGEGIEVRIGGLVGAEDLQDLVNDLRNSEAEAIAVNDLRLTGRSAITGTKDGLALEGTPLSPPLVVRAIGNPEALARGLERHGGVLQLLRLNHPEFTVELAQKSRLALPASKGPAAFQYAQPK